MTVAPVHIDEGLTWPGRAAAGLEAPARPACRGARGPRTGGGADAGGAPMVPGGRRARQDRGGRSLAREARDTLTWSGAPVVAAAPLRGRLGQQPVWAGGALVRSAQMAGGLEFLLAQSVKYVTERKQFGRPLAAFQAIQQNLALLAGHTAAAGMAAQQAFHVASAPRGRDASSRSRWPRCAQARRHLARASRKSARRDRITTSTAAVVTAGFSWRAEFGGEPVVGGAGSRGRRARRGGPLAAHDVTLGERHAYAHAR